MKKGQILLLWLSPFSHNVLGAPPSNDAPPIRPMITATGEKKQAVYAGMLPWQPTATPFVQIAGLKEHCLLQHTGTTQPVITGFSLNGSTITQRVGCLALGLERGLDLDVFQSREGPQQMNTCIHLRSHYKL